MATTNNKISNLVSSQLPFFVRNDHPNFVAFVEAYYEYLEQAEPELKNGKVIERSRHLLDYIDIDNTVDDFAEKLYERFLNFLPKNTKADKNLIIKNAKDFYRATGSEKSIRFLMRVLYNEDIDFYYPKKDILRASDGKWYIEKNLRIQEETINGVANTSTGALEKFVNRRITGNTSNASAKVESVTRFFDNNIRVDELVISDIKGQFADGETIRAYFEEDTITKMVTGRIFGGILNGVRIIDGGTGYTRGDPVTLVTTDINARGAIATVDKVSTGNISGISVLQGDGGAGYRIGDFMAISDPLGLGANAYVSSVNTDETYHPNTYNIIYATIQTLANANINNVNYGLYFAGFNNPSNANTTLVNSLATWAFSNTGPVRLMVVNEPGAGYVLPSIGVFGNTAIKSLGILGRMQIVDGGLNYQVGDTIEFINPPGHYGYGGKGNVTNVAANGRITGVKFVANGEVIGGLGYSSDGLPTANVITTTGNGANIIVTATLGSGGTFKEANTVIGRIERVLISRGGSSYTAQNTSIDMTGYGDGTANLQPVLLEGIITKPGRYINDDGHLSSFNFLEDRDYYQNFSFVVRVKESITNYRNALKDLAQPAGTKLFGDYVNSMVSVNVENYIVISNTEVIYSKDGTYKASGSNSAYIYLQSHGFANNDNVYVEFNSGVTVNTVNGIYMVSNVLSSNINTFNVRISSAATTSGNVTITLIET